MSRMLYAIRPGCKAIAVVDTRSAEVQEEQDETVMDIYRSVLATPNDDEAMRRRYAALSAYRGFDETAEDDLRSREAHRGLSAENKKTLTTVLLYAPHVAPLITRGEWERAGAVLKELAATTPSPERTRELAVALTLLEGFGMEDRHEAADDTKKLVAA